MEVVLRRKTRSLIQCGVGIDVDAVPGHSGLNAVKSAEVYRTRIEEAPFQDSALRQLHRWVPKPRRVRRVRLADHGWINDRVDLGPDSIHESSAVIDVTVLPAGIIVEGVRMDDASSGFDTRHSILNDFSCQHRDTGLKFSGPCTIERHFNPGLF